MNLTIDKITQNQLIVSSGLTIKEISDLFNISENIAYSLRIERRMLTCEEVKAIIHNSLNSVLRNFIGKEYEVYISIMSEFKVNNMRNQLITTTVGGVELWHHRAHQVAVFKKNGEVIESIECMKKSKALRYLKQFYNE